MSLGFSTQTRPSHHHPQTNTTGPLRRIPRSTPLLDRQKPGSYRVYPHECDFLSVWSTQRSSTKCVVPLRVCVTVGVPLLRECDPLRVWSTERVCTTEGVSHWGGVPGSVRSTEWVREGDDGCGTLDPAQVDMHSHDVRSGLPETPRLRNTKSQRQRFGGDRTARSETGSWTSRLPSPAVLTEEVGGTPSTRTEGTGETLDRFRERDLPNHLQGTTHLP